MPLAGARLRQVRERCGLSIDDLADMLDIPPECMEEIESGRRGLTVDTMKELAGILQVSLDDLLEGEKLGDDPRLTIGQGLRSLRQLRGWSLAELGRRAGVSPAHLSAIERGRSAASLRILDCLTAALGVKTTDLLEEREAPGDRIRRLREHCGQTQKVLAKRVGISPSLIAQIESGRTRPAISTLSSIARELGVSPCYLLTEQYQPAQSDPVLALVQSDQDLYAIARALAAWPQEQVAALRLLVESIAAASGNTSRLGEESAPLRSS